MRLVLVRHGETPSNVAGVLDAVVPGPGLTPLGESQAASLVERLADVPVDAMAASTMVRTQITAAPLAAARELEPVVLDGLREIGAGDLQGRSDPDAIGEYVRVRSAWGAGDLDVRLPGDEDGHAFFARADAAITEAAGLGDSVVVVSHAALIRTWCAQRVSNLDEEFTGRHPVPNTGFAVLEGEPGSGWLCVTWLGEPVPVTSLD